jgi:hypothetical protein
MNHNIIENDALALYMFYMLPRENESIKLRIIELKQGIKLFSYHFNFK